MKLMRLVLVLNVPKKKLRACDALQLMAGLYTPQYSITVLDRVIPVCVKHNIYSVTLSSFPQCHGQDCSGDISKVTRSPSLFVLNSSRRSLKQSFLGVVLPLSHFSAKLRLKKLCCSFATIHQLWPEPMAMVQGDGKGYHSVPDQGCAEPVAYSIRGAPLQRTCNMCHFNGCKRNSGGTNIN